MKKRGLIALFLLWVCSPIVQPANAITVLNFEGLQDLENVNNFYNGGSGSLGSSGTNYGINFSSNSLAVQESDPSANFTNPPSAQTIVFFLNGTADTMNVAAGFKTGFSFFYTSTFSDGTVRVYDGLNGTGNVLASLNLSALGACSGADKYCNWAPIGVTFSGIAKSVDFAGVANQIGFDNITLGSDKPVVNPIVPEPSALLLLIIGIAGLATRHQLSKVLTPPLQ